jgi:hypothetical protein
VRTWGDPHLTTLDGHTYLFNGYGEYVAFCSQGSATGALLTACDPDSLSNATTRVHLRFANPPTTSSATVTVGAGLVVPGQPPVLVILNQGSIELYNGATRVTLPISVGNEEQEIESSIGEISLSARLNNTVIVRATFQFSGISVAFRVSGNTMRITGAVDRAIYMNRTAGLWGLLDGNTTNDFLPSSTTASAILLNASEGDVFVNFGQTWMIQSASMSVFGSFLSTSSFHFNEFYYPDYVPSFTSPVGTEAEEQAAAGACAAVQDDVMRDSCIYDVLSTGDVSRALCTMQSRLLTLHTFMNGRSK